jgi:hypothetical protein
MSQKRNLLIDSATTKKDVVVKCKKPHASALLLEIKRKATLAGRAWPFLRDGLQEPQGPNVPCPAALASVGASTCYMCHDVNAAFANTACAQALLPGACNNRLH